MNVKKGNFSPNTLPNAKINRSFIDDLITSQWTQDLASRNMEVASMSTGGRITDVYSEPSRTSKMELFAKISSTGFWTRLWYLSFLYVKRRWQVDKHPLKVKSVESQQLKTSAKCPWFYSTPTLLDVVLVPLLVKWASIYSSGCCLCKL